MVDRRGLLYKGIIILLGIFLLLALALIGRDLWRMNYSDERPPELNILDASAFPSVEDKEAAIAASCIYLYEDDPVGIQGAELMNAMLSQMRVPYVAMRAEDFDSATLYRYHTMVMGVTRLNVLGNGLADIMDWVAGGGNLMMMYMPSGGGYLSTMTRMLGISEMVGSASEVSMVRFPESFMPGISEKAYAISGAYESAYYVRLVDDCKVYMETVEKYPIPLIWRRSYERGTVVVTNFGHMGKEYRGFYAAAYSLLGDGLAYPVINGSAYYLDGFPGPVPGGNLAYLKRDYGDITVDDFLTNIWWSDLSDLAEKYDVYYTGSVIEQYYEKPSDEVARTDNIVRYQFFGNGIIGMGGEIGYQGYNSMPLTLGDFEYPDTYTNYATWDTPEHVRTALRELADFCEEIYPDETLRVYVPPSNILSPEGRSLLLSEIPQIRAIAGLYVESDMLYSQEFDVSDDGVIETPRTVMGYTFEDDTKLTALSELTFHYVSAHAGRAEDLLELEKGADLGWPELRNRLEDYMKWLQEAAPGIRQMTGSELAGAVQRYDALRVEQTVDGSAMNIHLEGFVDEAWLLVRINDGKVAGEVTGGALEKVLDGLYLLRADDPDVTIRLV